MRPNFVKIIEELVNTSGCAIVIDEKSIDRKLFLIGQWRVIGGRHELTRNAKPEGPLWPPPDFPSETFWSHSGPFPTPGAVNPGERFGDAPYTIKFPEGGRYRLESEWGVLCGESRKELAMCKVRSSVEIEVPEGTFAAWPVINLRKK